MVRVPIFQSSIPNPFSHRGTKFTKSDPSILSPTSVCSVPPCETLRWSELRSFNPRSPISSLTEAQSSQSPILLQYPLRPPCAPCLRVKPSDGSSSDLSILDLQSILSQRHKVHRVRSSEPSPTSVCSVPPCETFRRSEFRSFNPRSSILSLTEAQSSQRPISDPVSDLRALRASV